VAFSEEAPEELTDSASKSTRFFENPLAAAKDRNKQTFVKQPRLLNVAEADVQTVGARLVLTPRAAAGAGAGTGAGTGAGATSPGDASPQPKVFVFGMDIPSPPPAPAPAPAPDTPVPASLSMYSRKHSVMAASARQLVRSRLEIDDSNGASPGVVALPLGLDEVKHSPTVSSWASKPAAPKSVTARAKRVSVAVAVPATSGKRHSSAAVLSRPPIPAPESPRPSLGVVVEAPRPSLGVVVEAPRPSLGVVVEAPRPSLGVVVEDVSVGEGEGEGVGASPVAAPPVDDAVSGAPRG
jgi:hypothetical protein